MSPDVINERDICCRRLVVWFQFDSLLETLNVNEFGNVDYSEFLKNFTLTPKQSSNLRPPTADGVRPHTAMSDYGRVGSSIVCAF